MTTSIRVYDLDNPSNELSFESSVGFFDAITRAAATFGKAEAVVVFQYPRSRVVGCNRTGMRGCTTLSTLSVPSESGRWL